LKEANKLYCDVSKVYLSPISKDIAKDIIVKKHYTHAWTMCRYALGIYYKTESENQFGDSKLIGCLIYGFPVGARASTSVCEGLTKDNILELTRLYCDDGGIYQATNWIYQGLNTDIALMPNYGISLSNNPYKWIHSRSVFNNWGSGNLEHLRKEIGKEGYKEFWRREEPPKHRYIQILAQDKKEKKDLIKRLKHEIKPYPKDTREYNKGITHHTTISPENEITTKFW